MRIFHRLNLSVVAIACLVCTGACNDSSATFGGEQSDHDQAPTLNIIDGNRGGGSSGFYWLPPVVTALPVGTGSFDNTVLTALDVEVCELAGTDCIVGGFHRVFTSTTGSFLDRIRLISNSQYQLMYATASDNLNPAKNYRATAYAYGVKLGAVDIDVVSTFSELQTVDRTRFMSLYRGQTLQLSFRIDDRFPPACSAAAIDAVVDATLPSIARAGFKWDVRRLSFLQRFATAVETDAARQALVDDLRLLAGATISPSQLNSIGDLIGHLYCISATPPPTFTVAGTVVGTNARGPLAGVTVTVQPSGISTTTGQDGTFSIPGVPLSVVTVAVGAPFPSGCSSAASQVILAGQSPISFQLPCSARSAIHWVNSTGGNWSNVNNWSLGRVPLSNDDIVIDAPGTYTVTLDYNFSGQAVTIGTNNARATLSLLQKTLSVSGLLLVAPAGRLSASISNIAGAGTLEVQTGGIVALRRSKIDLTFNNSGLFEAIGDVSVAQGFTTTSTSVLRLGANGGTGEIGPLTVANGFTNHGLIELTNVENSGSATGLTVTTGALVNAVDGTIVSKKSQQISGRSLTADLVNDGTLAIDWPLLLPRANGAYINRGTITVTGGDLTISGPVASVQHSGTWTIAAGRKVTMVGNGQSASLVLQQAAGAPIIGGGALELTSARAQFNGIAGDLVLSALRVNSSLGATNSQMITGLNTANLGSLDISQGTVTVVGGLNTAQTALQMYLARLNGTGSLNNAKSQTIRTGHNCFIDLPFTNAGELIAIGNLNITQSFLTTSTSVIRLGANAGTGEIGPLTIANGFTNHGLIELTNLENAGSATGLTVTTGALVNAVDGTIVSKQSQQISGRSLTANLTNLGLLQVDYPLVINGSVTNDGRLQVSRAASRMLSVSANFTTNGTLAVALPVTAFSGPSVIDANRVSLSGSLEALSPPSPISSSFSFLLIATAGCFGNPCLATLNGTFSSITGPPNIPLSPLYDGIASVSIRVF